MSTGTIVQLADYGAFVLDDHDAVGRSTTAPLFSNGLVFAEPLGGALIATGVYQGVVRVSWSTGEPAHLDLDDWEDVVQVVITPPAGGLVVRGFMESGDDGDSPDLTLDPEAQHMLRCYARGRDIDPDGVADEEPFEEYHLELWLRRPGDEAGVLKLTSEFGKQRAAAESS